MLKTLKRGINKLMTTKGKAIGASTTNSVAHSPTTTLVTNNFPCVYCHEDNISEYLNYRSKIGLNPYSPNRIPQPNLKDWVEFRVHMTMEHPEQWGRKEDDLEDTYAPQKWEPEERERVRRIYLNVRGWPEYGWQFFINVAVPGSSYAKAWTGYQNGNLKNAENNVNPAQIGIPKDESTIVGVSWVPRCDPDTKQLWNPQDYKNGWKYEKESRTHTRAQNAVGPQLGRGLNSIRRILRGWDGSTNLTDGCVLVRTETSASAIPDGTRFKSLYTGSCLLTKKALTAVSGTRDSLRLTGPGNLGQLQAKTRWIDSQEDYFITPKGIVVAKRPVQVNEPATYSWVPQSSNETTEQEIEIVEPTAPMTEDVYPLPSSTEDAPETNSEPESVHIELDTLLLEIQRLIPNTEHYQNVYGDLQSVFQYTRDLQEQSTSWNTTHLQEQVDKLQSQLDASRDNEKQYQRDWKQADDKLKKLGENPVSQEVYERLQSSLNSRTEDLQAEKQKVSNHESTIATLQKELNQRPIAKQQLLVNASNQTIGNVNKPPPKHVSSVG